MANQKEEAVTDTSWIPLPALARELGVHRRTIARWAAGSFPKPRVVNRRLYFQRDEIEAWKEATPVKSSGDESVTQELPKP